MTGNDPYVVRIGSRTLRDPLTLLSGKILAFFEFLNFKNLESQIFEKKVHVRKNGGFE